MCSLVQIPFKSHHFQRYYSAFAPTTLLDERNIKKTITKFSQMKPIKMHAHGSTRNAAVLVPLCVVNGRVSLLYTLRTANLKSHKGQVSFPGGMEDSADQGPEHTALRETEEELGIKPNQIEIWGKGNVIVGRGPTSVLPVIGLIKTENIMKVLRVNPSEVKEAFAVPLDVLCDPSNIKHTQFRGNYSLPVFVGGRKKIWGLTAIITHIFLKALLPQNVYNNNVKYIPALRASLPYRLL